MALNLCLFGKYKRIKKKNELLKVDVEDIKILNTETRKDFTVLHNI